MASFRPGKMQQRDERSSTRESQQRTCPNCDASAIIHTEDRGELLCDECGLVIEENRIDRGPEWRAFTHQERNAKSRVGAPLTHRLHDQGLTTTISWQDKDGYGQTLSPRKRAQVQRLRKWQKRIRIKDSAERNLNFALSELDRMASALGIPKSVREVAAVIYRRALEEDLLRGWSIEGVVSSSLYAACRQEGVPRSLDEVGTVSRVGTQKIGRIYRYLDRELKLGLEPVDPKQYLPRFASELDMSEEVRSKASDIIDVAAENGLLSGRSPTGVAGAALYAAGRLCDEHYTQSEVGDAAKVTEVTIRNRYQEQLEVMSS